MKRNLASIIFGSGLTAISKVALSAIGVPSGAFSAIGTVLADVLGEVGVNITAAGITSTSSKNIINLFKRKGKEEPNHDLYKAFIIALQKSLDEIYANFKAEARIDESELKKIKHAINDAEKNLSKGREIIAVENESMIQLVEDGRFDAEELLKETLTESGLPDSFISYFLKAYPSIVQKWFLEEIKNEPKAQVAYFFNAAKDIKSSLHNIEGKFDNLDKLLRRLEEIDGFLSLTPVFPEEAFKKYLETQEPMIRQFFNQLSISITDTLNRVEVKIDKIGESINHVGDKVTETHSDVKQIKDHLFSGNIKPQHIELSINKQFEIKIPDPNQKLKEAKKTNRTDFGLLGQGKSDNSKDMILETYVGNFQLHHNGTFTDISNQIMWIQAPWGMIWDGQYFIGEPIKLTWNEATRMFGKGVAVPIPKGALSKQELEESKIYKGYKAGSCVMSFAGFSDWRLPTAVEIDSIGFYKEKDWGSGFAFGTDEKSTSLREKLFPRLQNLTDNHLWSANSQFLTWHAVGLAWAIDGRWPLGDHKADLWKFVLLVRSLNQ